jgi:hypothetical protein
MPETVTAVYFASSWYDVEPGSFEVKDLYYWSPPAADRSLRQWVAPGGARQSRVFRPPPQPPVEARRADQGHPAISDDDAGGRAERVQVRTPGTPGSWCHGM